MDNHCLFPPGTEHALWFAGSPLTQSTGKKSGRVFSRTAFINQPVTNAVSVFPRVGSTEPSVKYTALPWMLVCTTIMSARCRSSCSVHCSVPVGRSVITTSNGSGCQGEAVTKGLVDQVLLAEAAPGGNFGLLSWYLILSLSSLQM